jgi:hypothetical protein
MKAMSDRIIIGGPAGELHFTEASSDSVLVTLIKPGFQHSVRVALLTTLDLIPIFDALALEKQGWDGKKEWESLEKQLHLWISCSPDGLVTFRVRLQEQASLTAWASEGAVFLAYSRLDGLAAAMKRFCNVAVGLTP